MERALGAFPLAVLAGLAKYFFVGYGPRNTRDRNSQYQKPRHLQT